MLDIGNYQEFTGYESQEITENSMDTANRIVATESTSGLVYTYYNVLVMTNGYLLSIKYWQSFDNRLQILDT